MAGGTSAPTKQEVTTTSSNLPDYARPYYDQLMSRAGAELNRDYTNFEAPRIADFTPAQQQIQQNTLNMTSPNQYGAGSAMAFQAGQGALQQNYDPSQFYSQQVNGPQLQQYQMGPAMGVGYQQMDTPMMGTAQTDYNPQLNAYQMGGARDVGAQGVYSQNMQGAQSGYNPQLNAFQMGGTREVSSQQVGAPTMQGAQTSYGQGPLEQFRMQGPEQFGQAQASQYMSPYTQNVIDVQKNEAIRDAKKGQVVQDLGAARQGTYGGSRQLLAGLERERNLGTQLGDIQARGSQAAYENAQSQFERDRAAGMTTGQQNLSAALQQQQLGTQTGLQASLANLSNEQQSRVNNQAMQFQAQGMNADSALRAAMANQGVDVTRAQANLQSQLGTQELGANIGTQTSLANLSAAQQANVQNQAAQLQTQGLNADQAMRAALANQQAGLQVGQQNLESMLQTQQLGSQNYMQGALANQQQNLEAQRLREQSRQFGSQQGLAGLQLAGQMGQTLGNLGQYQQQSDLQRLQAQGGAADAQQQMQQRFYDQRYADFLRQRDYQAEQLGQYSNLLRGLPIGLNSTQTSYAPPPSMTSQVLGTGLGALGLARTLGT